MSENQKAFVGLFLLIAAVMAALFIPAGTLHYWQAWIFLAFYFVPALAISFYLMVKDPKLLARRMRGGPVAEKQTAQKIIMSIVSVGFLALLVVPALDHRFGWSHMPASAAFAGNALMSIGWLAIFFVFRENSFFVRHRRNRRRPEGRLDRSLCVGAPPDVCRRGSHAARNAGRARVVVGRSGPPRNAAGVRLAHVRRGKTFDGKSAWLCRIQAKGALSPDPRCLVNASAELAKLYACPRAGLATTGRLHPFQVLTVEDFIS